MQKQVRFQIAGEPMPTVKEQPVKSLGRWYKGSLSDKSQGVEIAEKAEECLRQIQRSKLPIQFNQIFI